MRKSLVQRKPRRCKQSREVRSVPLKIGSNMLQGLNQLQVLKMHSRLKMRSLLKIRNRLSNKSMNRMLTLLRWKKTRLILRRRFSRTWFCNKPTLTPSTRSKESWMQITMSVFLRKRTLAVQMQERITSFRIWMWRRHRLIQKLKISLWLCTILIHSITWNTKMSFTIKAISSLFRNCMISLWMIWSKISIMLNHSVSISSSILFSV